MTAVTLEHLTRLYEGADTPAVNALNLHIADGSITALLGPSGCGKTTTLKMIAGLLHPTSGDILFDGHSVIRTPAEKRNAVMVFQNHLLFPYMTVGQNIGFGLKMRGVPRQIIKKRVAHMLARVQLPDMADRRPDQLSGGQQQRVALARALITDPAVLLLDEPLSNLDAHLRDEMRDLIRSIQEESGITTIIVTHDRQEAVLLADHIGLMMAGNLLQYAPPADFYHRPHSETVARFFGGVNFLSGTPDNAHVRTPAGCLMLNQPVQTDSEQIRFTIRPEQIRLNPAQDCPNTWQATITQAIFTGTTMHYHLQTAENIRLQVISSQHTPDDYSVGERVRVQLPPQHLWILPD